MAAAAALLARHPTRAYRALHWEAHGPEENGADRFSRAIRLLTGLEVSLTFETNGIVWTIAPGEDWIADELFRTGAYSGEAVDAVLAFATEHRVGCEWIVDVGANIGTTTVPFASAGYRVLAIEPVPAALRCLRSNVEGNGLQERVRVLEAAVAAGVDEVLIAVSTSLGNSEVISTPSSTPGFEGIYGRAGTIRVPALELDEAVRSSEVPVESVAIVWSDTQGSETPVIETGSALWSAGVPLFAEFWPRGLESKGGLDNFVSRASEHFKEFIAVKSLAGRRAEPCALTDLYGLAEALTRYPGEHADVLLLP